MPYATYSRLNGACSTLIGVVFIIAGWPGLFDGVGGYVWTALPAVVGTLAFLAAIGRWRGAPLMTPGRWLTERSLSAAASGLSPLPATPLRNRLLVETAIWGVVAFAVIIGLSSSYALSFITGWASLVYGFVELLASARRIEAVQREQGVTFLIAERPGIGTPEITT